MKHGSLAVMTLISAAAFAAEGWATGKIRGFCDMLGLRYELFLASPPSYPLLRNLPFGAAAPLSYDIGISALGQVLRVL